MKHIEDIINEGSSNQKLWDQLDTLKEELGAEKVLDELCKAMTDDQMKEYIEFIAQNYEIKI